MAPIGTMRKSRKQQALDAELGLIIDDMGQAMWNANKEWVAAHEFGLTIHMNDALRKFQSYCVKYYGKK